MSDSAGDIPQSDEGQQVQDNRPERTSLAENERASISDKAKACDTNTLKTRSEIFVDWHRTEALWREIYARTVATLAAAFVAYVVAVLGGLASPAALWVIVPIGCIFAAWTGVNEILGSLRAGRTRRWKALFAVLAILVAAVSFLGTIYRREPFGVFGLSAANWPRGARIAFGIAVTIGSVVATPKLVRDARHQEEDLGKGFSASLLRLMVWLTIVVSALLGLIGASYTASTIFGA